jgi:hypothetical protein
MGADRDHLRLVVGLLGQLQKDLGVLEPLEGALELVDPRLVRRLLFQNRLGLLSIAPEIGSLGDVLDLRQTCLLAGDVKDAPGGLPVCLSSLSKTRGDLSWRSSA